MQTLQEDGHIMRILDKISGMRFTFQIILTRNDCLYLSFPPVKAGFSYVFVTHSLYWGPSGATQYYYIGICIY